MAELRAADAPALFESVRRTLLRRLADLNDRMAAAEPGTDDFLTAYNDFTRLREMYRHVRDNGTVPDEVWEVVSAEQPLPAAAAPSDAPVRVMKRVSRAAR